MSDDSILPDQPSPFVIVPEALWKSVASRDIAVYCALASFADHTAGLAWPSRATIADLLSISLNTVDRSLKNLEDAGFVRKTHRVGADGQWNSNMYELPFAIGNRFRGSPKSAAPLAPQVGRGSPTDGALTRFREPDIEPPPTPPTRTMLPEEVLARQWCEITGQKPTPSVLRHLLKPIREYLAVSDPPSKEMMENFHRRKIRSPGGWGLIPESSNVDGGAIDTSPARNNPEQCKHRALDGGGWCAGCSTQVAVKDVDGNLRWLPNRNPGTTATAGSPSARASPERTTTIVNFLEGD